jgi:hypothetical protein
MMVIMMRRRICCQLCFRLSWITRLVSAKKDGAAGKKETGSPKAEKRGR